MKLIRSAALSALLLFPSQAFSGGDDFVYAIKVKALLMLRMLPHTIPLYKMLLQFPLQFTSRVTDGETQSYFRILGELHDDEVTLLRLHDVSLESGTLIRLRTNSRYHQLRLLLDPLYSLYFLDGTPKPDLDVPLIVDGDDGVRYSQPFQMGDELFQGEPLAPRSPASFQALCQDGCSALVAPEHYPKIVRALHPLDGNQPQVLVLSDWLKKPNLARSYTNLGTFLARHFPEVHVVATTTDKPCETLLEEMKGLGNFGIETIDNNSDMKQLIPGSFDLIVASETLCVCHSDGKTCAGLPANRKAVTLWLHKVASKLKPVEGSFAVVGSKCAQMIDLPWSEIRKQFLKIGVAMELVYAPKELGGYLSMIVLRRERR